MRLHFFGLAEFPIRKDFVRCAFVPLAYNFCKMAMDNGHEVILYGCHGTDAPCTEFVELVDKQTLDSYNEGKNYNDKYYAYEINSTVWQSFINKGRIELNNRYQRGDVALISLGNMQKFVQDTVSICCEYAVGYAGSFANHQVFASYAWMHNQYGCHQRTLKPGWYDAVIPHYLNMNEWEYQEKPEGDYLLFLGRLGAGKGEGFLKDIAERTGKKIIVSGTSPAGTKPEDFLGSHPLVEFVGSSDHARRVQLMKNAQAFLCPTTYVEPFGMVAIEAMACGTPVITTDWGAFVETVEEGVTGFHCRTLSEFCSAVNKIPNISRKACRERVEKHYSLEAIWPQYERYFKRLLTLNGKGWYE